MSEISPPNATGVPARPARAHQHAVVRHVGLAVPVLHVEQELLGVVVLPGVVEPQAGEIDQMLGLLRHEMAMYGYDDLGSNNLDGD
jgi:hypothetical protein